MFYAAYNFNQPIGEWNVSKVTNMNYMFHNASNFNQLLGGWNVSNVIIMDMMFANPDEIEIDEINQFDDE